MASLIPNIAIAEDFDIKNFIFQEFYVPKKPDNETFSKLKHGVIIGGREDYERAVKAGNPRFCGKYVVLDYGSEHDGPIYYINASDGSMFSVCGMTCDGREKNLSICRECPPKDLNCDNTCDSLLCSIRNNDIAAAKRLISGNADIKELVPPGQTLLNFAVFKRRREIIKLLLDAGANVNERDKEGRTALGTAVGGFDKEIVKILINAGADPSLKAKIFNDRITPLEFAEQHNSDEISSILTRRR